MSNSLRPGEKMFILLSGWYRFVGAFLMVLGLVFSYYFIYLSIKPEWLQFRVFTIYSKYFETTTLSFIENNQGDEVAIFCYFVGFLLFLISRGKSKPEIDYTYKINALIGTLLATVILLPFCLLFVHGTIVLYIIILSTFAVPIVFVLLYLFQQIGKRE